MNCRPEYQNSVEVGTYLVYLQLIRSQKFSLKRIELFGNNPAKKLLAVLNFRTEETERIISCIQRMLAVKSCYQGVRQCTNLALR